MEIIVTPNKDRTGIAVPNAYNRARLLEWLKKYEKLTVSPVIEESKESQGYLYGAVVCSYCRWQYGIDPREPGRSTERKFLFMRDFNSKIERNRDGDPVRVPQSSKGQVRVLSDTYTRYAEENGAPIPNPTLFKKYRDEWKTDLRFPSFYDWLDFLGIEEDAMPSDETFRTLYEGKVGRTPDYPEGGKRPLIYY